MARSIENERRETIGPYTLLQRPGVFPLGGDSLALGKFTQVRRGEQVCDLGCGSGVLSLLLLSREPSLTVTGLELDESAAALAEENYRANALPGQVVLGDLRRVRELFLAGSFDLVVSNPPYFPAGSGDSGGPARMEESCTLEEICAAAAFLAKNGGRLALVHRPERLCDLFCTLRSHDLEPKRLRFVQARIDSPPSAILVEAYKQGKPGLTVLPPELR